MSVTVLALLAILPILAAAIMLIGLRWPARIAMPIVFVVTAILAWWAWDISDLKKEYRYYGR